MGLIKKYYDILCAKQKNAVRNKIKVTDIVITLTQQLRAPGT